MENLKIAVYAISKNEAKHVEGWMKSMNEADEVIVTDTGSTDDTAAKLRECGAVVYEEAINPWRFDIARNISLGHVPKDVDICICTDLDERFHSGWRKKLEEIWQPDATMVNYLYNWSLKKDGSPNVQLRYFKIHAREQYIWEYPIHECLKYIGKGTEKKLFTPEIVLNHYPDPKKSRTSYLDLLELAVKEMPEDSRMRYYLGREYMYAGKWGDAITTLAAYLGLPNSSWKEERCAAMRWTAKCCYMLNQREQAYQWYFRAIAECPGMRDAYIELAQYAYTLSDFETVYYMVHSALKIKEKSTVFTNMGYAWDHTPCDLMAISCYYMEMYEKSYFFASKALEKKPDDMRLTDNLKIISNKCNSAVL